MNIKHTQNFYKNKNIISKLISRSNFKETDLILDIGAGEGIITDELVKYSGHVIAIEKDIHLINKLRNKYKNNPKVTILNIDFDEYELPNQQFKVFSNIPFNRTTEILKTLMNSRHFIEGYIYMQKEALERFTGINGRHTLISILNNIDFNFEKVHVFNRNDFRPIPNIDIVLMKIARKDASLIEQEKSIFYDFVSYIFNKSTPNIQKTKLFSEKQLEMFNKNLKVGRNSIPSNLNTKQYIEMFNIIKHTEKVSLFRGYYDLIQNKQSNIQKHFRTRNDRYWKVK